MLYGAWCSVISVSYERIGNLVDGDLDLGKWGSWWGENCSCKVSVKASALSLAVYSEPFEPMIEGCATDYFRRRL